MDLGKILGRFWEAKIIDFRTFFDVFSKHFSSNVLESKKIEKNCPTKPNTTHFGSARRNARPAGEGNGRGEKA